jgi:hypothetical protein
MVLGGSATHDTDPEFVEEGAVAWLLLKEVGTQVRPKGGDTLADTTFVQRVNTHGGLAPSTGCASLTDVGKRAFVPYKADYVFYTESRPPEATDDSNQGLWNRTARPSSSPHQCSSPSG